MTSPDGTAGYAEGPNYFQYLSYALLPFMRAQDNFLPEERNPLIDNPRYKKIFDWSQQILAKDGIYPTYDNSSVGSVNMLGILGEPKEWPGDMFNFGGSVDFRGDYILANAASVTIPSTEKILTSQYINEQSGNAILRNYDDAGGFHYFQMLCEEGYAVDKPAGFLDTHEDVDMGAISIFADDQQLLIDPPYMGWETQGYTNQFSHHNVLCPDGQPTTGEETATISEKTPNGFTIDMHMDGSSGGTSYIKRQSKVYITDGKVYYVVHDKSQPADPWDLTHAYFNGNGRYEVEGSFLQTINATDMTVGPYGRIFKWYHPCNKGRGWALLMHSAVMDLSSSTAIGANANFQTIHGSGFKHEITNINGFKAKLLFGLFPGPEATDRPYGIHDQVTVRRAGNSLFQSTLMPYRCDDAGLPKFTRIEDSSLVATIIQFPTQLDTVINPPYLAKKPPVYLTDTITDIHIAHSDIESGTITAPSGDVIFSHAERTYVSMSQLEFENPGICTPSYMKFKKMEVSNGTEIRINDTVYLWSSSPATIFYERIGKFKYKGFISTSSVTSVTFRMPDVQSGYDMYCANGAEALPSVQYTTSQPDSFKLISVTFQEGLTEFTLELSDPCMASCFFPPTNMPIDSIYIFDTGEKEVLAHDLEIIQDKGEMYILKGSKMSICSDYVFASHDSLIMYSLANEEVYPYQNEMDGPVTTNRSVLERLKSKRSMIIVNDRSALVLDSGSFTHVGDHATILVLKGGTLLVRKGAVLEIGGSEGVGKSAFGEVIAEEGAYVCIEDSSDIHFYLDTLSSDTFDNNVMYVSLNDYVPTIAGTNPEGGNGKFVDSDLTGPGIYAGSECIAFCDIKNVMPPHGIQNRDFGWCNFSEPVARLSVPDYVCKGDPIILEDYSVLNETWFKVRVKDGSGNDVFVQTATYDTPRFVTKSLPPLEEAGNYEIHFMVLNDCGEGDTIIKYITVPSKPIASFTFNTTGCQEAGGVTADGSASAGNMNPMRHLWHVQRLDSIISYQTSMLAPDDYTMEWEVDSLAGPDSNFTFPGFAWVGGYSYIVGLTVYDYCHDSTWTDTVTIPLGVHITAKSLKSSNNYIGINGVELTGVITSPYDSFEWSPESLLTGANTLIPVTTTLDSTAYILSAYKDECVTRDTIIVKHREYVHLGDNRVVCVGDSIVVGNYLEASLMIGLVGYLNPGLWGPYFDDLEDNNTNFRMEFTRFLYNHEYQFMEELESCGVPFVQFLKDHRQDFYTKPHYARLYEQYLSSHHLSDYIDYFKNDFLNEYEDLDDLYRDHMDLNGGFNYYRSTLRTCVEDMIGHMMDVYGSGSAVNTQWYVDHVESTVDENLFIIGRQINQPTHFGLLVNNDGLAEYDETMIYTDTVIVPGFSIGYMMDSTVYFNNHTENDHGNVTYIWVFGDGDSSAEVAPFHTFRAFDSTYIVCLYATNACGTFQYCDTLIIDSAHEAAYQFNKRGNSNGEVWQEEKPMQTLSKLPHANLLGYNRPNPFSDLTEVDYELRPDFKKATLVISNPLGQSIREIGIPNIHGTLVIDSKDWRSGMYYYSLVVDGVKVDTKIMVVR